jgi:hypothetical protein
VFPTPSAAGFLRFGGLRRKVSDHLESSLPAMPGQVALREGVRMKDFRELPNAKTLADFSH